MFSQNLVDLLPKEEKYIVLVLLLQEGQSGIVHGRLIVEGLNHKPQRVPIEVQGR